MTIDTIKHFQSERGFRFIADDDGYKHAFHISANLG
jgi:cold shock CspA family protein